MDFWVLKKKTKTKAKGKSLHRVIPFMIFYKTYIWAFMCDYYLRVNSFNE